MKSCFVFHWSSELIEFNCISGWLWDPNYSWRFMKESFLSFRLLRPPSVKKLLSLSSFLYGVIHHPVMIKQNARSSKVEILFMIQKWMETLFECICAIFPISDWISCYIIIFKISEDLQLVVILFLLLFEVLKLWWYFATNCEDT